jgi:hypothetical protein
MQAGAASDAADSQAASSAAAIAEQRRQADRAYADQAQYRETGGRALTSLEHDINGAPSAAEVMSDPGYAFGLQQGQQGLDRKAAAAGGRVSGAALKAASEYATNYASTGYNAAYQRRQDRLNRLAALAGIGQTATSASAASGQNAANNISSLTSSQGDATGAAQLARGNIWGNATNQLGAAATKWINSPSSDSYLGTGNYSTSPTDYSTGGSYHPSDNYG